MPRVFLSPSLLLDSILLQSCCSRFSSYYYPTILLTLFRLTEVDSSPFNYHVYMVLKPMHVTAGCIAPWFEQPGLGIQYLINGSVTTAIQEGFLRKFDGQKSALLARGRHEACGTCKPTSLSCPGHRDHFELLAGGIRPTGLQR